MMDDCDKNVNLSEQSRMTRHLFKYDASHSSLQNILCTLCMAHNINKQCEWLLSYYTLLSEDTLIISHCWLGNAGL